MLKNLSVFGAGAIFGASLMFDYIAITAIAYVLKKNNTEAK